MNEDIFELKLHGYCCSQIIMELGLRKLGKENSDLVAECVLPSSCHSGIEFVQSF
jgi:hypothetical protein